jgi:NADH dehydrogenase
MATHRQKVVIIGAGFGGLAAAQRLAGAEIDVTIVDRQNHHLFQPLLYQVATAALSPADIAAPIRSILARALNVRVLLDEVVGVDIARKRIELGRGEPLSFDWLIVATGARHSYFGRDHWAQYSTGLKSIDDALAIRRRVLLALELAETERLVDRRQALLTFVVVGGGPTGVEMAGAIAELARRSVSKDFRSITPHCSRVLLIEAGPRLLPAFPEGLSSKAERDLKELGVEVMTGAAVTRLNDGQLFAGDEQIASHTIVWAAGVEASPAAKWLGAERDKAGRVFVEADLTIQGQDHIFVIGDTANAAGANGQALPGIAPVAKQQGRYAAERILGRSKGSFRYRSFGNLATIGRKRAVIDWDGWEMSGLLAWLIWSLAHVWFLVGFRSRIVVGIQWLWNYLTYQRSARLITGHDTQFSLQLSGRKAA